MLASRSNQTGGLIHRNPSRVHSQALVSALDFVMARLKPKYPTPPAPIAVAVIPPTPCKDFMNLKEAAAYYGVKVSTIRGLIAKGFIKAKRIGKYDVVRRTDLAEYWEKAA